MRATSLFAPLLLLGATAQAAAPVSAADRAFVAMVSQGGMFEVQAGTLAATQGATQDIRDQGTTRAARPRPGRRQAEEHHRYCGP